MLKTWELMAMDRACSRCMVDPSRFTKKDLDRLQAVLSE